jgi:hypothetical protein
VPFKSISKLLQTKISRTSAKTTTAAKFLWTNIRF